MLKNSKKRIYWYFYQKLISNTTRLVVVVVVVVVDAKNGNSYICVTPAHKADERGSDDQKANKMRTEEEKMDSK